MQKNDSSADEIEVCQNVGPHEIEESVKSQAVVKFSTVQVPANFKFNRLELNTNLNLPPANWLTTSDSSHGLHQSLYQTAGFASFRLGHMFPDIVGEVDVVSDAENIKKLLKMPFTSKNVISMFVHKVGNTLLLDEFDIQKYLLRRADNDWDWLRTFILEQILAYGQKDHNFCLKDKSREAIQTKNLLSKFLYYSLKQNSFNSGSGGGGDGSNAGTRKPKHPIHQPLPITGPLLPEPKIDANVPDPKSSHDFNRNVLWTFEDIRMLIGTDMPIFGGPNRPCISLRLRDMTKPINVLTGIDYWLDNLMCNVPEVVMCYHLDGIVQKYEIIKTEDLPYLEDSQFSPRVVRNVAQNILAFLKANATKAGHTYWLFKGRNDDVVKLYDLTTLCKSQSSNANGDDGGNDGDEKQDNPFTVPVGMLLYTVARNMKNSAERLTPKIAGNIRALLDNCIKLLPKEKYPQIVTSSHYLLSDLHVPDGIDPKCPKFDNSDKDSDTQSFYDDDDDDLNTNSSEEEYDDVNDNEDICQKSVPEKQIRDTLKEFKRTGKPKPRAPSPLRAGVKERCLVALKHVSAGISNLKYSNSHEDKLLKESEERAKEEEKQRILHEEQNPNMAKPHKPIPLPYETLKPQISNSESDDTSHSLEIDDRVYKVESRYQKKSKKIKIKTAKRNNKIQEEILELKSQMQPQTQLQSQSAAINFNSQRFGSWNLHLKLLLLEKACLIYAILAEHYYNVQKYGFGLKALYISFRCQHVVLKYMNILVSQRSCLLGRAGDFLVMMSKNVDFINEYLRQFHEESESDTIINNELENELNGEELIELIEPQNNLEQIMMAGCKCYENSLEYLKNQTAGECEQKETEQELLRRLGNIRNELGLTYMCWAESQLTKEFHKETSSKEDISNTEDKTKKNEEEMENTNDEIDNKNEINQDNNQNIQNHENNDEEYKSGVYRNFLMKSYDSLACAIFCFKKTNDIVNLVLVYSNLARFMRFRAHAEFLEDSDDCLKKLKTFYQEAFLNYENARDTIGTRKSNPEMWDQVSWELSTTTFMYSKQLHEYYDKKGVADPELEKDILEASQRSLRLCDVENSNARQVLYAYRAGLLHKRIATIHYKHFITEDTNGIYVIYKNAVQLSKHHMDKAISIFAALKEYYDYLSVQVDRIKFVAFLADQSTIHSLKMKHLKTSLKYILETKWIFEENLSHWSEIEQQEHKDPYKLMELFMNSLQQIFKTMTKLVTTNKDYKKLETLYKNMYMETLTGKSKTGDQKLTVEEYAQQLKNILNRLNELEQNFTAEQ